MTQISTTCTCTDYSRAVEGDLVVTTDSAGDGGNITASGTVTCATLIAGNIAVSTGQATVETATFTADGATTVFSVSHTQSTRLVSVAVYNASGEQVLVDTDITSDTTIQFTFGTAPASGTAFTVVVFQYLEPTVEEETT